jgi:hypothetical protein
MSLDAFAASGAASKKAATPAASMLKLHHYSEATVFLSVLFGGASPVRAQSGAMDLIFTVFAGIPATMW